LIAVKGATEDDRKKKEMQPGEVAIRTGELAELRLLAKPETPSVRLLRSHGRSLGAEAARARRSSASEWISTASGV
jgi:hypothetical protein